jgi:hypothetical protein
MIQLFTGAPQQYQVINACLIKQAGGGKLHFRSNSERAPKGRRFAADSLN